jgi:putative hydrolase of the HAD superfamily
MDAGGHAPRGEVAAALVERYGDQAPGEAVRALLDRGSADRVVLADPVREALDKARANGWVCVIVTNGRTVQQETKIRRTGLDRIVDGWVVSEAVGCAKPEPGIFAAAARVAGLPLAGAWMIGDTAPVDIAGARGVGVRSVWVSGGRTWTEAGYRPDHVAEDVVAAIGHVISAGGQAGSV